MACGRRREPEGTLEDCASLASTKQGACKSPETTSNNSEENSLSQQLSSVSLNETDEMAPSQRSFSKRDVSVCLHRGSPGTSPPLISIPFQEGDRFENFVPCTVCHSPNDTTPRSGTSDTIAYCVSEVNVRSSQLILVPCNVCSQTGHGVGIPEQIRVPLNLHGGISSDQPMHFVPCRVCLSPEHLPSAPQPAHPPSRDQQISAQRTEDGNPHRSEEKQTGRISPSTPVSWFIPFSQRAGRQSLQLAFLLHCKQVISQVRQRQRELPIKASLRLQESKNVQAASQRLHQITVLPDHQSYQPFSHTQMRIHTERMYRKLPEVKEQEMHRLLEQSRKTHRIMAYIFQKKLQQATLRGKVSWQITESCM